MSKLKTPFYSIMGEDGMLLDLLIEHKVKRLTFADLNPVPLMNIRKEGLINLWRHEGIIDHTRAEEFNETTHFSFVPTKNERTKTLYEYYTATVKEDSRY